MSKETFGPVVKSASYEISTDTFDILLEVHLEQKNDRIDNFVCNETTADVLVHLPHRVVISFD